MFPTLIPVRRRPRRPQKNDGAARDDSGAEVHCLGDLARGGATRRLDQPVGEIPPALVDMGDDREIADAVDFVHLRAALAGRGRAVSGRGDAPSSSSPARSRSTFLA
jgi:hypothetical protein